MAEKKLKIKAIDDIIETLTGKPETLPLADVLDIYYKIKKIAKLEDALKKFIIANFANGAVVTGYKLVNTRPRARIDNQAEALARIKAHIEKSNLNIPIEQFTELVNLTTVEKLLGAGDFHELLADLVVLESKGLDIATLDDDREPVKL